MDFANHSCDCDSYIDYDASKQVRVTVRPFKPQSRQPKRPSTSGQQSTVDGRRLLYHSAHGISNIPSNI
eukprot:1776309-Pyramimonas_sp.AAC.1